jgi:PilZ domain-containing protein
VDKIPEAFEWLTAMGKAADCSKNNPPRAQRFEIRVPLLYRTRGETAWREGRTVNISHTGVRFWTDQLLEVQTPIELSLKLPAETGGETRAEIQCRGKIVRTVLPASTDAQPSLAATILEYRFVRASEPLSA